jgi:hypothetical protein
MAGRLTRFLNLERPHVPGEKQPQHQVATAARFTGEPSGIALEPDFGEQPFLRCPRCEADNSRYAERCTNCRAPLTGEEVRAWNERLWAERKAQKAKDEAALRQARAAPDLVEQNRRLGEALAREVGERERSRMSWWWGNGYQDPTPIGFRLLSLLPGTQARIVAGALAAITFVGAAGAALGGRGHPRLQGAGFIVGLLLLVLFTPNVPRRRRWWW